MSLRPTLTAVAIAAIGAALAGCASLAPSYEPQAPVIANLRKLGASIT